MGNIITSAYDGDPITVDSLIKDPKWIAERTIQNLDGAFLEDLLFRNTGSNDSGVAAFREAASPFLADDAEVVAEFGEIPVSGLNLGKVRTVIGQKVAMGIRVSYEQRHENRLDMVSKQQTALQNTMIRSGVRASLAAFAAAETPTAAATAAWSGGAGDPAKDVLDAIEQIQAAKPDNAKDDEVFGYNPNTLVLAPVTLTALLRNEQVQKFYIGDNAAENPLYTGVHPKTLFGLTVATSRFMDPTKAIVLESGVAGFRSDTIPLQMTPLYQEGGESGMGGPNMSWRSDAVRKRIIAVDEPKSVLTITGVTA